MSPTPFECPHPQNIWFCTWPEYPLEKQRGAPKDLDDPRRNCVHVLRLFVPEFVAGKYNGGMAKARKSGGARYTGWTGSNDEDVYKRIWRQSWIAVSEMALQLVLIFRAGNISDTKDSTNMTHFDS
ncbi:hypothetical protein BPAE_0184g00190 [Botrytis paeoniae]|uniref:Uncharacterized protein n=1 Tax=Botrytis paeoniae TaxID=278948 RepID=A0A4Z1FC79_9HELO|nr:hypothetical protein BPAE_0184g00190 [Botrytis paeoniae]